MTDPEIEQALDKVLKSLQELTGIYDRKVDELRIKGLEQNKLMPLLSGSEAMKDSAGIFLTWAKHYSDKLAHPTPDSKSESVY